MKFKVGDKVRYKVEHYAGIGEILVDDTEEEFRFLISTDEYGYSWFRDDEVFPLTSCDDTEEERDPQCDDNRKECTSFDEILKDVRGDYETYEGVEDMINEPPHYATRHIQPNDYIDDLLVWNTALTPREGYCIGQIHRYLGRAGMKEGNEKMQDFKKAQYYMNRMIENEGQDE